MIHKPPSRRKHSNGLGSHEGRAETASEAGFRFIRIPPARREESFAAAVLRGLSRKQKDIPSRFFYDIAGSRLFEQITRLPEYYLTRCETDILQRYPAEIIEAAGDDFQIIEFGSGSSEKTRLILRAAVERQKSVEYVPIDISSEFLEASSRELLDEVSGIRVTALAGDYLDAICCLPAHAGPRLFLFLGSTIGNFERSEAVDFLAHVYKIMRPQDRLLVGQDLRKPAAIVEPAYNDASGVTEKFNKNILDRINRELCGHFDLDSFEHRAPWVESRSRIEMRLISLRAQEVTIEGLDRTFRFEEGEYIHTENSHKWSEPAFESICAGAGLSVKRKWFDGQKWFTLNLLEAQR